ncbi:MAG: CotH kinase family protein [bacterium]
MADTVTFVSSNLPIIIIDNEGQSIKDEERISVKLGIINNSGGQRNFLTDAFTDYDGRISIEIRGSSSADFEKKSYGFETQNDSGENNNVSLLSMPAENDWILYGPYSDKTLLRNALPYYLARELDQYASRTEFCELLINGEYQGLYVLMEKIKRDKNRVDITELTPEDIEGDELTGGYIIKVDKPYNVGWQVDVEPPGDFGKVYFQFHHPKEDEMIPEQKAYIQNFIFQFENCLVGSNYADPVNGYSKYIDVNSFVDHFLIQEFTKCLDSYRFSFFMYKKRDSEGGKLYLGPIWDFDLAFGNFGEEVWEEPWTTVDWNAEIPAWYRVFWMKRLLEDVNFRNKLKARWTEIRQGAFSNYNILEYINQTASVIEEARVRNFTRWQILGKYVWPNYFVGATYEEEIDYLKNWITERLNWMDLTLAGTPLSVDRKDGEIAQSFFLQQNYPNPFNPSTVINYMLPEPCSVKLTVYNLLGQEIKTLVDAIQNAGDHSIDWNGLDSNNNPVSSGVYLYRLETETSALQKKMLLMR